MSSDKDDEGLGDPQKTDNLNGKNEAMGPPMLRLLEHDILTAVSDVVGGIRLIEPDRLDPDTQIQFERIRVAGETLAELMDSALMVAAGQDPSEAPSHSLEFRTFLAGIELRWAGRAYEQGLRFRLNVDPSVPERIRVARLKLDRILGNLLSNALKYTESGEVRTCVRVEDGALVFRVRDQGQGFSDHALQRLFTANGRPTDATQPGTGLGLHISKELATSLGGDLAVVNLEDGGAIVSLTLPPDSWECRDVAGSVPDLSDLRVLVAEDNETNQIIVRQMLEAMGAEMVLACDGVEALDLLINDRFDIALIDIEMPRKSGIDVMAQLRAIEGFTTPLVALTAYVMRDNREAIYAAGADGVIAKPIRSQSLFGESIRRHVDRRIKTEVDQEHQKVSPGKLAGLDRNRFEAILQAAGSDGREEFLSHLVTDLKSVLEELRRGVAASDPGIVRAQTHILISLSGAIGAERMQAAAESLNATAHHNHLDEAHQLSATCLEALAILIEKVESRWRWMTQGDVKSG